MTTPLEKLKKEALTIRLSQAEKAAMYARIEGAMRMPARPARPAKSPYLLYSWRMVGTFAVLVVVVLGTGTTYAAEGALPGSPLYAIKVGVNEPVKQALAFSNEAKVKFHTETAQTRLEEAETLASEGRLDSGASAVIAANLTAHVEQVQTLTHEIEQVDPDAALEVSMQFDSSLAAHGEVLARLGDTSGDESTRENSLALAQSAAGQDAGTATTAGAMVAMKAVMPLPAAPEAQATEIATLSVQVASDSVIAPDVSTTVPSSTAIEPAVMRAFSAAPATSSSEDKLATQLQRKASDKLQALQSQFNALKKTFTATTTASVKARIGALEDQLAAGKNAQKTGDYSAAKADYNETLRGTIELSTFLAASKKFDAGILDSLLSKYNLGIQGEVEGVMDEVPQAEPQEEQEKNGAPGTTTDTAPGDAGESIKLHIGL